MAATIVGAKTERKNNFSGRPLHTLTPQEVFALEDETFSPNSV